MCDENVNFSTLTPRVLKTHMNKIIRQFLIAPTVRLCYYQHHPYPKWCTSDYREGNVYKSKCS